MPYNNTELAALLSWLKENLSLIICSIMAFISSYLLAWREDIMRGTKTKGKFISSLLLSLIALPIAMITKELVIFIFDYQSENIPMLVGFFVGFWGVEKIQALTVAIIDRISQIVKNTSFSDFIGNIIDKIKGKK